MIDIAVIGGGAAGFFGAIACAEANAALRVVILEQSGAVLGKVKVSGGGRCNVTNACQDPAQLVQFYPRGSRELLGPFNRFGPRQLIDWFDRHGVALKTEADGRMFPTTDNSQTIIDCLTQSARAAGVEVRLRSRVTGISAETEGFSIQIGEGETLRARQVLVATGSSPAVWEWLAQVGHSIVEPVPSLFTFHITDDRISGLAGLSVPMAEIRVGKKICQRGPLLVTHWGMSGPAVLRTSAWGARELANCQYQTPISINWAAQVWPDLPAAREAIQQMRSSDGKKGVQTMPLAALPARLWKRLCEAADISESLRWADLSKKQSEALATELSAGNFLVTGKSTFKEEFVTAGGVSLREIDFRTLQSRKIPGLFFAGEVLDIDAVTGGFNFQAAWTTSWLAGTEMAKMR